MLRAPLYRFLCLAVFVALAQPAPVKAQVQESRTQVERLNAFADELLSVVSHWQAQRAVTTTERIGGYARRPGYFREVEYFHKASGQLAARVRWIVERPDLAQMIELFLYDKRNRLIADYYVSYLAEFRNAPMFALINVHQADKDLQAFRQFDIFGEKLYEKCQGNFFGKKIDLDIDPFGPSLRRDQIPDELYASCFGFLPLSPDDYVHPAALVPGIGAAPSAAELDESHALEERIAALGQQLARTPDDAKLYVERGNAYLKLLRMDDAATDFGRAIAKDDTLDGAYFGRGMAFGRLGRLDEGIADLTVFLTRNPNSSVGYTKRGVRRIWNNDLAGAFEDLSKAVQLDDNNAEAHDDLGVVLAQTGKATDAIGHFDKARSIDPSYQKAHHNLAMALYMTGDAGGAIRSVDRALELAPDDKNALMLKSTILESLGQTEAAKVLRERAEFLPDGNWSERSALQ